MCRNQGSQLPTTVGTTFYVPYNKIDFKTIKPVDLMLGRGPVIALVVITFSAYFILLIWAWREDSKDKYKVEQFPVM